MAAIKAKDIIAVVRDATNDRDEPYRVSPSLMLSFVGDAQEYVATARPDANLATSQTLLTITPPSDDGAVLSIDGAFKAALVHYTTMRCLQLRGQDRENLARVKAEQEAMLWELR